MIKTAGAGLAASDLVAFEAALERAGVEGRERMRLARYGALLAQANARTNLTAARTPEAIVEHVVDSLSLAPLVGENFADIGSGGGFPAFPLGIVTERPALLVESVIKKARFLEETARALELPFTVVAMRAETVAHEPEHRERYATATARAVSGITVVLEFAMPLLALGGSALLQRGRTSDDERRALADAALVLGGRVDREIEGPDERRVFVVVKERPTQERFPRRSGIPDRRPLCVDGNDR